MNGVNIIIKPHLLSNRTVYLVVYTQHVVAECRRGRSIMTIYRQTSPLSLPACRGGILLNVDPPISLLVVHITGLRRACCHFSLEKTC
jgi:hypothetical protein